MTGSGGIVEVQGTAETEPFSQEQFDQLMAARPARHRRAGRAAEAHRRLSDGGRAQARRHGSSSPPITRARCASLPSCSRRSASRRISAAKPRTARTGRDRRRASPRTPGSRPKRRRPPRACSRSPTIQASRSRRLEALPASIRRAGADRRRISVSPWQRVNRELEASGTNDRRANFVCALALAAARSTRRRMFEGKVFGTLVWPPRGTRGFGYDPIFVPDGYSETFGEMRPREEERHVAPHARLRRTDLSRAYDE